MEHAERMAVDEDRTPEEVAAVAPSEPSEPHGAPQLERLWARLELLGQADHPSAVPDDTDAAIAPTLETVEPRRVVVVVPPP